MIEEDIFLHQLEYGAGGFGTTKEDTFLHQLENMALVGLGR